MVDPVKKSQRSGYGTGSRGAQAARRKAREPQADEECLYCHGVQPSSDDETECGFCK
jgi:hypothetical protein